MDFAELVRYPWVVAGLALATQAIGWAVALLLGRLAGRSLAAGLARRLDWPDPAPPFQPRLRRHG